MKNFISMALLIYYWDKIENVPTDEKNEPFEDI